MTQPTNKIEYFKFSNQYLLPARCPVLGRCERRAQTLALMNSIPLDQANDFLDQKSQLIACIGESPYKIGGRSCYSIGALCPEVSIFETTLSLCSFSGIPVVKANYDELTVPQMSIIDTGHYSQCPEFSSLSFKLTDTVPPIHSSWIRSNYQWIIGTLIAIGSVIAAFLALKKA